MRSTSTSSQARPSDRRRGAAALLAGLGVVTLVVGIAPVAAAGPAASLTANRPAHSTVSEEESVTLDDLRSLVQKHEADGGLTRRHAVRLQARLDITEVYYERGITFRTIHSLQSFKQEVADPRFEPSESAVGELTAAADQLIAQLGGTP